MWRMYLWKKVREIKNRKRTAVYKNLSYLDIFIHSSFYIKTKRKGEDF